MPAPFYRDELGRQLTKEEADENIRHLHTRVDDAVAGMTLPIELSNITQSGLTLTFHLSNATVLGTATIPVLALNPRGFWEPDTAYFVNDVFTARGIGDYIVKENFTSGTTFNPSDTRIAFQRPDNAVQLPLYIDMTVGAITVTRAEHLNRLLVFLGPCDVTVDPDDWIDGDQWHGINRSSGTVAIFGTTAMSVEPPEDQAASVSVRGGAFSAFFLEGLGFMALAGKLDAVSA